ncbi:MAG: hypothetical protein ABI472_23910 [Ginsengibacter sp.]
MMSELTNLIDLQTNLISDQDIEIKLLEDEGENRTAIKRKIGAIEVNLRLVISVSHTTPKGLRNYQFIVNVDQ